MSVLIVALPVFAELLLDDLVVREWDALLVNFTVTTFCISISTSLPTKSYALTVDEFTNRLLVGVTVSDKGLDNLEHLHGSLGKLDEDTIVDLEQAKQLQGLALLRVDLIDTLDAHNEHQLRFLWDIEAVVLLCLAR